MKNEKNENKFQTEHKQKSILVYSTATQEKITPQFRLFDIIHYVLIYYTCLTPLLFHVCHCFIGAQCMNAKQASLNMFSKKS